MLKMPSSFDTSDDQVSVVQLEDKITKFEHLISIFPTLFRWYQYQSNINWKGGDYVKKIKEFNDLGR